jgi:hypothetical protein
MLYLTAAGACGDPQGRMTAARAEVESDGQIGEPLCLLWWEVRPRMSLSLGIAVLPKGLQAQIPGEDGEGPCAPEEVLRFPGPRNEIVPSRS